MKNAIIGRFSDDNVIYAYKGFGDDTTPPGASEAGIFDEKNEDGISNQGMLALSPDRFSAALSIRRDNSGAVIGVDIEFKDRTPGAKAPSFANVPVSLWTGSANFIGTLKKEA